MSIGYIHSFESMGLVDGPGIRSVVFMQGCRLRCRYCHNPDTWSLDFNNAWKYTPEKLLEKVVRFKPYYKNNGGVTFSGGEPLLQMEFLGEVLPLLKEAGIHTCIDTAGVCDKDYTDVLKNTDLVIFDIKHFKKEEYKLITGMDIDKSVKFLDDAQKMNIPLWIRHVVVPGITDSKEHIIALCEYVSKISNVKKVELLPYHTLGVNKYKNMGIKYPLEGVLPLNNSDFEKINQIMKENLPELGYKGAV